MNIPEQAKVILAFGHIRDGKNLDQIIYALRKLQDVHLLVSGREQSGGERPVSFYQQLARELGVAERCHWHGGYVSEDEVWKYFRASDVLALIYSTNFRSASGVLNVNAQFRLPVIVSGGDGPLLKTTRKYGLGVVIDKPEAGLIASAFAQANSLTSDWDRFASENSWETNAKLVAEALGGRPVR
jgi:glycosyltransferase involved in cell wall biosynthesis